MKKYLAILALLAATGCKGETEYGECIGLDDTKNPARTYEVSTRNVVWAIIFIESLIVPVVWGLDYVYCPTGNVEPK